MPSAHRAQPNARSASSSGHGHLPDSRPSARRIATHGRCPTACGDHRHDARRAAHLAATAHFERPRNPLIGSGPWLAGYFAPGRRHWLALSWLGHDRFVDRQGVWRLATMFVLLNGAFGIGKTTAAKAMVAQLASASIYDPEPLGVALQRASVWTGRGGVDDFQDLSSWRRLIPWAARWRHRGVDMVITPMAFSNLAYFEGLAAALSTSAPVLKLCLVAPIEVVRARLEARARTEGTPVDAWALRRAEECCRVHGSSAFGHPIDATGSTLEIVRAISRFQAAHNPPE